MTETPSSQSSSTPAAPQSGAGIGEWKFLALGHLFAIAKDGNPDVLANLDDYYFRPKS